ncbi:MAG: Hsp20/alpha crystallin family protein [Candidatus Riflebacteria bacterium]|nr:Hsp20/alpha crystallin family protein [Candidatus Riflebacteria bacterium]
MSENKIQETKEESKDVIKREVTRHPERYISPQVDIYETDDGLVLVADLPGVEKDTLEIKVEDGILTIEAHMKGLEKRSYLDREFGTVSFFRQFELYEAVDQKKIDANLSNGVLTLNLPKAEKQKPRQIEVKVA